MMHDLLACQNGHIIRPNLAYLITIYISILSFYIYKNRLKNLFKPLKLFLFFLLLQIILGVLTLVSGLNIYLASAHQISSILLVFTAITHMANYFNDVCTNTLGSCMHPKNLPPTYIPIWLSVKLPLFIIIIT